MREKDIKTIKSNEGSKKRQVENIKGRQRGLQKEKEEDRGR